MADFGFSFGFNYLIGSYLMGGGTPPTEIFTANAPILNKTSQYFEIQGGNNHLDIGTGSVSLSAKVYYDGSSNNAFFAKGRHDQNSNNGDRDVRVYITSGGALAVSYDKREGGVGYYQYQVTTYSISIGWHDIVVYDSRSTKTRDLKFYVDGIDRSGGSWVDNGYDGSSDNMDNSYALRIGVNEDGSPNYSNGGTQVTVAIGQEFTLDDAIEIHNGGTTKCYDIYSAPLKAKVSDSFGLLTYSGHSELDARTGSVSGLVLNNVNSAPFSRSAQIECEPYTPPVGIQWTQDFSLLDPVTDVVYGIDPAVTTWIDKGTSSTNLTQTTVANQADLVAGYDADGPNLVTNGDFATDSDWTKSGTWVISGGQASCSGGFSQMKQDGITGISGNLVELTMDIVSISSGTLKLRNNGSVIEEFSTTGTFKFYFEAQDDDILFEASGSTVSIDNVVITQTVANTTKNELVFDTTDYYDGIETQAGDFTYYFEMDTSLALGIASRYVSSTSSGNSSLIKKASDGFRLISQESNNNDFSGYNETGGLKKYAFVKEGASAKLFVSGVLESTIGTLIGTFSYDRLGRNSSSALSALKAFKVIDRALTDAEAIAETT